MFFVQEGYKVFCGFLWGLPPPMMPACRVARTMFFWQISRISIGGGGYGVICGYLVVVVGPETVA